MHCWWVVQQTKYMLAASGVGCAQAMLAARFIHRINIIQNAMIVTVPYACVLWYGGLAAQQLLNNPWHLYDSLTLSIQR
jgi:hypothetical protein